MQTGSVTTVSGKNQGLEDSVLQLYLCVSCSSMALGKGILFMSHIPQFSMRVQSAGDPSEPWPLKMRLLFWQPQPLWRTLLVHATVVFIFFSLKPGPLPSCSPT